VAAKQKSNKEETIVLSIFATIAIVAWYLVWKYLEHKPTLTYVEYIEVFIGVLCGLIASSKNRNRLVWSALGIWFFIIPLIILPFLPRLHDRLCPHCREAVAIDASVCPHCQRDIPNVPQEKTPLTPAIRLCPHCSKAVRVDDSVCPYCRYDIPNIPQEQTPLRPSRFPFR
jgi:hypothetical protein